MRIDQALVGRNRKVFFEGKLSRALASDVQVSLGAEIDGTLVGVVLGSVAYGEFGRAEPIAVLDTILVDPAYKGRGAARGLMEQLFKNLGALRIERIRTQVDWTDFELLAFLAHEGFSPAPRLVLERAIG